MTKSLLFLSLLWFVQVATPSAQTQTITPEAYDLKGDHLGMSLAEFQKKHHDPGHSEIQYNCDKTPCQSVELWKPDMSCTEDSKSISTCTGQGSVAGVAVNTTYLFADGQLAGISLSFSHDTQEISSIQEAMLYKFGTPVSSLTGRAGSLLRWDNGVSVAMLQEHLCQNGRALVSGQLASLSQDLSDALQNHYCDQGDALSYRFSRVLFVHKELLGLVEKRIKESLDAAAAKSRGEI